jgi:hypothetical protein
MSEAKHIKKSAQNCKIPKEKLGNFDKPFNIFQQLCTPLGLMIDILINDVEISFPEPTETFHIVIFQDFQSEFALELLWVLKEETNAWSRTDYPFNTKEARALESRGWWASRLLNLANKCSDFDPSFSAPLLRWTWAMAEIKQFTLKNRFAQGIDRQKCFKNNNTTHNKLSIWENPYNHNPENDLDQPREYHLYNLFESAIRIGQLQPNDNKDRRREKELFRLQAWKPYLDALQKMNRDQQDGVGDITFPSFEIRGNSVVQKIGGRKIQPWFTPSKENISGRGRKPNPNLNNPYTIKDAALLNRILTGF